MKVDSEFNVLLDQKKFAEATSLLKDHLKDAKIINPKKEETWREYADIISSNLGNTIGQKALIPFWEDLLRFFQDELEPSWGPLHKGRIYFRLGVYTLFNNIDQGKVYLEQALEESRREETKKGSTDADKELQKLSSYTALCIVEQIQDIRAQGEAFSSASEQLIFFNILFTSFDSVLQGVKAEIKSIEECVNKIVPPEGIRRTMESWYELNNAYNQRFKIAVVSLAGIFTENILLSIISDKLKIDKFTKGKREFDILEATPMDLLKLAVEKSVFLSDDVKIAFQLIHFFRNRGHPGVEISKKYKLTERIAKNIKVLADKAVEHWAKQIDVQQGVLLAQ